MLIRLISLVILFCTINFQLVYSINHDSFIYPKNKPPIFNILKTKKTSQTKQIIPINKPQTQSTVKKKTQLLNENKSPKVEKKVVVVQGKKSKVFFTYPRKKPITYKAVLKPQKKSEILNSRDFAKAKEVFKLIDAKKWRSALKLSATIKDKDFKYLVEWMYLKQTGNTATFNEYQKFINKNSDYPRIGRLRYMAEHKIILKNLSPNIIISWFGEDEPLSGVGKIKLAEAHFANKNLDLGIKLLKSGWVDASLSKSDLRYYRNKFKKFLTEDDHIKRADYLAWNNKYWDLKRLLRYLPKDERALYNARQILMSNSYGVDKAISDVPQHLKNNTGLEFDRLKWRNRRGRLEGTLEILYANANKSEEELIRGDLWWKQRESITRSLIYKKRYKTAYKVSSEHSLSSGSEFAEAEWLSGWIALSFLDSAEYAISHFENFYDNVSYPISLARGAYWLGQSYKGLGNNEMAKEYFKQGSVFLNTYYGQLSYKEINGDKEFFIDDSSTYSPEYEKEFNKNKLIKHIKLLKELDKTQYGKDIFKHLATLNIDEGSEILAAKLATEVERYDFAIQISKKASYEKRFFNEYNYPIINTPRLINNKEMPKSELVLAIIRQESEFDSRANSYVGARGMMQLMKYTAKTVAKQAKLPYSISRLTKDPDYNIKLGSYYFKTLLDNYDGVYPFAIAAYNAGPNRVKTWRKINGDPSKNELSYINWIELIRFKETRNYVQRVLENANVYKYMIEQKPVKINGFFK